MRARRRALSLALLLAPLVAAPARAQERRAEELDPEGAVLGLQNLELQRRPRLRAFGSYQRIRDEETARAGLEVSRQLAEPVRLHALAEWMHLSGRVPSIGGHEQRHVAHAAVWLVHEVVGLDRRLILEPGVDLWSGDAGSALASPRARLTWKALDDERLQTRLSASAAYRALWTQVVDALPFEGRVSEYRIDLVQGIGPRRDLELVELGLGVGWRRYETGGRRTSGGGYRELGDGERFLEARVEALLARDPVRLSLGYTFFRSRLDLAPGERGRIPIIEDSIRHTVQLSLEAPLTHTLSVLASGFLSGDRGREIDFGRARGGQVGLRWRVGLRLTVEGSYAYNSEAFIGTSGEVHLAELALTYVF